MSKQQPEAIAFHYIGTRGEHFSHVPARDLTVREFERLSPINQVNVRAAAFYKAAKGAKAEPPPAEQTSADSSPAGAKE